MSLVGGLTGLCCWIITTVLSDHATNLGLSWLNETMGTIIMGSLIGGFTVGFADRWTSDRVVPRWVLMGILLGAGAGALTGLHGDDPADAPTPDSAPAG